MIRSTFTESVKLVTLTQVIASSSVNFKFSLELENDYIEESK
jgi:hypothetical protein